MDNRNYNEKYNCDLDNCDCDDDNNCGCTYPNNISNFLCLCPNKTPRQNQYPNKKADAYTRAETICTCNHKECDCTTEQLMKEE